MKVYYTGLAVNDTEQCTMDVDLDGTLGGVFDEYYVTAVFWVDDDMVALRTIDRLQQQER